MNKENKTISYDYFERSDNFLQNIFFYKLMHILSFIISNPDTETLADILNNYNPSSDFHLKDMDSYKRFYMDHYDLLLYKKGYDCPSSPSDKMEDSFYVNFFDESVDYIFKKYCLRLRQYVADNQAIIDEAEQKIGKSALKANIISQFYISESGIIADKNNELSTYIDELTFDRFKLDKLANQYDMKCKDMVNHHLYYTDEFKEIHSIDKHLINSSMDIDVDLSVAFDVKRKQYYKNKQKEEIEFIQYLKDNPEVNDVAVELFGNKYSLDNLSNLSDSDVSFNKEIKDDDETELCI